MYLQYSNIKISDNSLASDLVCELSHGDSQRRAAPASCLTTGVNSAPFSKQSTLNTGWSVKAVTSFWTLQNGQAKFLL